MSTHTYRGVTVQSRKAAVQRGRFNEIARSTDAVKRAYTAGQVAIIDDIAAPLAPSDPQSARARTLGVFALMVGTLQVSRALSARRLSDRLLEQGIQNVLALLGTEGSG